MDLTDAGRQIPDAGRQIPRRGHRDLILPGLALLTALMLVAGLAAVQFGRKPAATEPAPVVASEPPLAPVTDVPVMATPTTTIAMPEATVPTETPATTASATPAADCTTAMTASVNVDPTAGEISGTAGLPDHVSYFKPRGQSTPCSALATTVTTPR
jgi:hypothetical protein